MIKLVIEDVEREVEIIPAPQGSYFIYDDGCFPHFPTALAICRGDGEYGDIAIAPIESSSNGGYENAYINNVFTDVTFQAIDQLIENRKADGYEETYEEGVKTIIEILMSYGSPIAPIVKRRIIEVIGEEEYNKLKQEYK